MGDGQALFGNFVFTTDDWIIDGVTGGGPGSWENGFGIKVKGRGKQIHLKNGASHIKLAHLDLENRGRDTHDSNEDTIYALHGSKNITISHWYLHDVSRCQLVTRNSDGFVIGYSKLARNGGTTGDDIHR